MSGFSKVLLLMIVTVILVSCAPYVGENATPRLSPDAPRIVLRGLFVIEYQRQDGTKYKPLGGRKEKTEDNVVFDTPVPMGPDGVVRVKPENAFSVRLVADVVYRKAKIAKLKSRFFSWGGRYSGSFSNDTDLSSIQNCCRWVSAYWALDTQYYAKTTLELWVVDADGRESNRVSLEPIVVDY